VESGERTTGTNWLLHDVQAAGKLPTPPGVLIRLLELSRKPEVSARELAETVAMDPGLSAKVLRFVNSPLAGLRSKVSSLPQAVALMGVRSVKMMALSFSAVPRDGRGFCDGFDHQRFALQSLACAIAARRISEETHARPPHDCYLAGLLSQIGRSIFATAFSDQYAEVLAQAPTIPTDLPPLELARFGESYATLGGQVLKLWGLPEELCHAVQVFRGEPEELHSSELARILRGAEAAAAVICPAPNPGGADFERFFGLCRQDFDLDRDCCARLLNETAAELETYRAIFDLPEGEARLPSELEAEVRERITELSIAMHLENQILAQQQADLLKRATTDALTSVGNRAAFDARLALEIERAARLKTPLALILVDIDRFKSINDTHGHLAGDHALRTVARTLDENIRKIDYCARYGGEEFAIIAPSTPLEGVSHVSERLRQSVESASIDWEGKTLRLTISVGAALASNVADPKDAARDLIAAADRCLYEAKCAGRNQVVITPKNEAAFA